MIEETSSVTFQAGENLPESASTGEQKQESATQETYITREEAKAMADAAAETALRKAQSLFDKGRDGILKRVQADLQALEKGFDLQTKAGVPVTPEQRDAAKQKVIAAALTEAEPELPQKSETVQPSGTAPNPEAGPDPITAEAWAMMKAADVTIEDTDPEMKLVDQSGTSALKFLRSIEVAIEAKKARLATPVEARIPGPASGAAVQPASPYAGMTPYELFAKAYSKQRR